MPDDPRPPRSGDSRERSRRSASADRLDRVGPIVLVGFVAIQFIAGLTSAGDPIPQIGIALGSAFVLVLSAIISRRSRWVVPAVVVAGMALYAVARSSILIGGPHLAPLGYSNAAASLFLLGAAAALMLSLRSSHPAGRIAGGVAYLPFASIPWLNGSDSAAVLVVLLVVALLPRRERHVRWLIAGSAALVATAVTTVAGLGAAYRISPFAGPLTDALSARRFQLWAEAVTIFADRPFLGVGPGRFRDVSPTAISDSDTIWPHNEFLHFAAESGIFGVVAFSALVAWCFLRLRHGTGDRGTAVSAVALAAVLVHATIDYILHFPAIPIVAAALLGCGAYAPARISLRARRPNRRGTSKSSAERKAASQF
jgi:O-antigen ligase